LLYGARSPDALLYTSEYDSWKKNDLILHTTVDRSQPNYKGNVGVVPLLLERLQSFEPSTAVLFISGPDAMIRYTARAAIKRGMSPTQIWISTERNMQCAIGQCGHCQLGPAFICKDGPVFRYDQIAPYMKVEGL
jgi:NAD(P)H-flavin reductase